MEKEENTNSEEIKSEKLELNEEKKEENNLGEKNENERCLLSKSVQKWHWSSDCSILALHIEITACLHILHPLR